MTNEELSNIIDLKVSRRILTGLVDTILDSCRLNYDSTGLVIDDGAPILAVLRAFFYEEYSNRLDQLKVELLRERARLEEEIVTTEEAKDE